MRKKLLFAGLISPLIIALQPAARGQQSSEQTETNFPSDTKPPDQTDIKRLLETVCSAEIKSGKTVECRERCPEYTDFPGDELTWEVLGLTFGHFLSPTSDDATLSMSGCEPHSLNFGGTVLLTRQSNAWSMVWYKAGVDTSRCHKAPTANRREILVCIGQYGAQGNIWTALYTEDLSSPKTVLMAGGHEFFTAYDNTIGCGNFQSEIVRSHISRVEFVDRADGHVPAIWVSASFGKQTATAASLGACMSKKAGSLPETRNYRMQFIFNGDDYRPAPSSISKARIFALQTASQR